jgi:hypothetical protein
MHQSRGFQSDIDNQTDVVEVNNYMIAPVYGFRQDPIPDKDLPQPLPEKVYDEFENEVKSFVDMDRIKPIGLI